ncbi:hypothetical protein PENTCL1PPCAC_20594 [Pristionchus entomophagus]|uniref:G protein-coupled receptor n=1 Tax=Pristionchus entomophagus TaxID=358040 RepID=A0AAV5TVV9_9BILA|nr:hypothetical protein PENTCL1PPCAC_20594 [Pristionchus entomophagus]
MVTVDASYPSVQMFIRERMITDDGVFAVFPTSSYEISKGVLCAYFALTTLSFMMIDFSFLYRMWALKYSSLIYLFSAPVFLGFLSLIVVTECIVWFAAIYWFYLPTESGRLRLREYALHEYGVDTISQPMFMGDYFLDDGSINKLPAIGLGMLSAVLMICIGFMVYALCVIIHALRTAELSSNSSIRLQKQLVVTLCLQTLVPLVSLYIPCGVTIFFPLIGLNARLITRASPILISCFLPLDLLATLITMTDYRREIIRVMMLGCPKLPSSASINPPGHSFTMTTLA